MPVANRLKRAADEAQPEYPIRAYFCPECALVQTPAVVPKDEIFLPEYVYFSSYSDTMLASCESLANRLVAALGLGRDALAIDVGSNDGYLLRFYRDSGVEVLGIEPHKNVASVAEASGVPTLAAALDAKLAAQLVEEDRRADVLHAHNVLNNYIDDLPGFASHLQSIMRPDGVLVIEVPYVVELVDKVEFDTIYHEHLAYYSFTALERLLRQVGLRAVGGRVIEIHGGSIRLFAVNDASERKLDLDAFAMQPIAALVASERIRGVDHRDFYRPLAARARQARSALRGLLGRIEAVGGRVAAYGASAKGATLVNYCGISGHLECVVDRSPHKQGLFYPGTRLEIRAPEVLRTNPPDYLLLLAWNLTSEIIAQQRWFSEQRGQYIVPVPLPQLVS